MSNLDPFIQFPKEPDECITVLMWQLHQRDAMIDELNTQITKLVSMVGERDALLRMVYSTIDKGDASEKKN